MKHLFLYLLVLTALQAGYAQISYPISTYNPTPQAFKNLLLTNQQIEDNDTMNEEIVDLVTPVVLDSVLDRKREHHQLFLVGWFIHAFGGYGWRELNMVKEKAVGTVKRSSRSGAEEFTEYDVNFDLYFHTRKYLFKTFASYDTEAKIGRQNWKTKFYPKKNKPTNYHAAPYVRDTNNIDLYHYRVHCELTPIRDYRPMLNYLFYPVIPGINIDQHPNFMTEHPTMGFYGASCLDCNHGCHPEIHPYDWAWWMNLHTGSERDKTWLFGLFKDGSNRFHHWTHNPKSGKASIPFSYRVTDRTAKDRIITIEHLVFGKFIDSNLTHLDLPPTLFTGDQKLLEVNLKDDKGVNIPITVVFANVMKQSGVRYWFSDVNWDEQNRILSGFLNFATSVENCYTTKVTFSGQ